jgi:hypothetical protein
MQSIVNNSELFDLIKNYKTEAIIKYKVRQKINNTLVLQSIAYPTLTFKDCYFFYACSCAEHKCYFKDSNFSSKVEVNTYSDKYDIEGLYFGVVKNNELLLLHHLIKPC